MRTRTPMLMSWFIACILMASMAFGDDGRLLQEVPKGGIIDWGRMVIRCTGVGVGEQDSTVSEAKTIVIEAARTEALEKILISLESLSITSEMTVAELLESNSGLRDRIRALAGKFREKGIHYMSDGSVEIEVELTLRGELIDLLLPSSDDGRRVPDGLLCPLCGQPWPANTDIPDNLELKLPQGNPSEPYSGLVIDARGTRFQPALAPRVLNESGKTIYGIGFARRPRALVSGLVSFEGDLDAATKLNRMAPHPLVVKALGTRGTLKADVVIETEHGALLHSSPQHLQFMAECRVIIVVD